jgi:hypothetical protein
LAPPVTMAVWPCSEKALPGSKLKAGGFMQGR